MISGLRALLLFFSGLTGTAILSGNVLAGGLQIAPVTLTLQGRQNADGIWLSNEGDTDLNAQVRVYYWTQRDYTDRLSPSQGLVISPPILALGAGQHQLVRVIQTGATSGHMEDAYRLSIDELPSAKRQKNKLEFVIHYSVPVFIQPSGMADATPTLQWSLVQTGGRSFIEVCNSGSTHAQLSQVTFINDRGARKVLTPGLLGYILPGSTMRWDIPSSAGDILRGGKFEVTINGQKTVQNL